MCFEIIKKKKFQLIYLGAEINYNLHTILLWIYITGFAIYLIVQLMFSFIMTNDGNYTVLLYAVFFYGLASFYFVQMSQFLWLELAVGNRFSTLNNLFW